jgi:hypothetical protein
MCNGCAVGYSDRAIHDICAVVSYFSFVNRVAHGLGVELEERFSSWVDPTNCEPGTR